MPEWRIDEPESFDLEGVRRLSVRLIGGDIDIVGHRSDDDGVTHVEVSELEGPLVVSHEGDTLVITHERLTWGGIFEWLGRLEHRAVISISVPADCVVELGVVSADAVIAGISAPAKIKSVSGTITLDGVTGEVQARSVSGDLESRGLIGPLKFATVSGDLTVVESEPVSLTAETISGQVMLDLEGVDDSRIDLTTISGDLTLRLPETANISVHVKTMSGELDSAFAEIQSRRKPGHSTLRGQVGDGRAALRGKTVSGDVTLLKRAAR